MTLPQAIAQGLAFQCRGGGIDRQVYAGSHEDAALKVHEDLKAGDKLTVTEIEEFTRDGCTKHGRRRTFTVTVEGFSGH